MIFSSLVLVLALSVSPAYSRRCVPSDQTYQGKIVPLVGASEKRTVTGTFKVID
ncbi:hypothetical protein MP638_005177, partial [Amoeboaphelidium occidentale]